MRKALV
jgi:hypothetical protein